MGGSGSGRGRAREGGTEGLRFSATHDFKSWFVPILSQTGMYQMYQYCIVPVSLALTHGKYSDIGCVLDRYVLPISCGTY